MYEMQLILDKCLIATTLLPPNVISFCEY